MAFDPHQLDEIRAAVRVSEIVGSRFPLIKKGSEYVAKDNPSFTVNDTKGIWCEYGSGGDGKGHTIFDFLTTYEGFTFVGAVEELAKRAGITLAQRPGRSIPASSRFQDQGEPEKRYNGVRAHGAEGSGDNRIDVGLGQTTKGRNEIVATWQIVDTENVLLYEVVRWQERLADGSWRLTKDQSKPWKKISQRRPSPDGDGSWIWTVFDVIDQHGNPIEFMRYKGDWIRFDEKKFVDWKLTERRVFPELKNIDHWYYNANDIVDELQEAKEDQRTIWLPEGEPKVDCLKDWGLLALSNTGGAKNFTEAHAEFLRDARHVVILQDNDRAGAERVAKIAPMLKAVGVDLVQALNFRDVWPLCPVKGDIKDWRDKGGGTKDGLLEIVESLKPWTPAPYQSKFGAKTAADLTAPARAYPWRIKFLVPRNVDTLIMGPSRSGKTFEALDMCMHVHFGKPYAGKKTEPGGVVYLTYEGSEGFENRLRAYMLHHGVTAADLHSFAWLTRPAGLYATEDSVREVAQEIVEIAKGFQLPLSHSVIDTHNAATRGSSEIKSEDLNRIMANYSIIRETTGAPLWVVGHTNAEGKHRGNEQFFNGIESALLVNRVYTDQRKGVEKRDDNGRIIRCLKSEKQREGDDRLWIEFILESVKIGVDEDGDDITSMVSVEPAQHIPDSIRHEDVHKDKPDGFYLRGHSASVFRALLRAIENVGKPPPPELGLPSSVGNVVQWRDLGIEYKKTDPRELDESIEKYSNRIKQRTKRFREELLPYKVIGMSEMIDNTELDKPRVLNYVWPTGRRVYGKGLVWPPPLKKKPDVKPLLAPGETELPPDVF